MKRIFFGVFLTACAGTIGIGAAYLIAIVGLNPEPQHRPDPCAEQIQKLEKRAIAAERRAEEVTRMLERLQDAVTEPD